MRNNIKEHIRTPCTGFYALNDLIECVIYRMYLHTLSSMYFFCESPFFVLHVFLPY